MTGKGTEPSDNGGAAKAAPAGARLPHIGLNAHLLASGANYRRAGIHGYIFRLLEHLPAVAPEFQFTVFVGAGQPPDSGLRVKRSRLRTENPLSRILWEQIAQPFQLNGLDLVHEMAFAAPVIMPRPFVVTVYDLTFIRYPERLPRSRRLYLRLMTGLSCRRARRVIAISQSTAADVARFLKISPARIDLAIPGVDARFRPLPAGEVAAWRERNGLPPRFLLHLGTIEPRKNLVTILRALKAIPENERPLLALAGARGWMTAEIDATIEALDLAQWVRFPGYVSDEALVWWYNAAEALVYPSVFEGWGLPVTEAMACGTPVLVSNVSSLPEAAGDAGVCLPPEDVEAWTEALAHLLRDPVWRADLAQRGQTRAAAFTWERTAQQTAASFRNALGL